MPSNSPLGFLTGWCSNTAILAQLVEQVFCKDQVAGSSPVNGSRGISSVGRAPALQAGCQEFESPILHLAGVV